LQILFKPIRREGEYLDIFLKEVGCVRGIKVPWEGAWVRGRREKEF
jgi:hypothetical protein